MLNQPDILRFPETDPIHPIDLYGRIARDLASLPDVTYVSGSITSGLAARNPEWGMEERVLFNREFALLVINALAQHQLLPEGTTISAHMIGPRHLRQPNDEVVRWKETDFLVFWVAVMARLESAQQAHELYELIHSSGIVDTDTLNDHSQPKEKRLRAYTTFSNVSIAYAEFCGTTPLTGILRLPDSSTSLGCGAEKRVAQALNIPISTIHIDHNRSVSGDESYVSHPLFTWLTKHAPSVFTQGSESLTILPTSSGDEV